MPYPSHNYTLCNNNVRQFISYVVSSYPTCGLVGTEIKQHNSGQNSLFPIDTDLGAVGITLSCEQVNGEGRCATGYRHTALVHQRANLDLLPTEFTLSSLSVHSLLLISFFLINKVHHILSYYKQCSTDIHVQGVKHHQDRTKDERRAVLKESRVSLSNLSFAFAQNCKVVSITIHTIVNL